MPDLHSTEQLFKQVERTFNAFSSDIIGAQRQQSEARKELFRIVLEGDPESIGAGSQSEASRIIEAKILFHNRGGDAGKHFLDSSVNGTMSLALAIDDMPGNTGNEHEYTKEELEKALAICNTAKDYREGSENTIIGYGAGFWKTCCMPSGKKRSMPG